MNESLGVQVPNILLPVNAVDHHKWAVIACDQFTSQPEYWQDVDKIVGDCPSTLRMILPEVFLETENEKQKIEEAKKTMEQYLQKGVFQTFNGCILVERQLAGKTRFGLMIAVDLEKYDFSKGSQTLIRATEGTILDRLPPRIRIREGAKLEFPHIIVLIDDPEKTVIEPLVTSKNDFFKLYDFDLMKGSGHLKGYAIDQEPELQAIEKAFRQLADKESFQKKYQVSDNYGVLLFAMGDGNHSLATAKSVWEKIKPTVGMNHPARYALVEIENIHDDGLEFEPIHRVLFSLKRDILSEMRLFWKDGVQLKKVENFQELVNEVDDQIDSNQKFGFILDDQLYVVEIFFPATNLPVGTLQLFLDKFMKAEGADKIDYVHGGEVTYSLGRKPGNCGFYLPAMPKNQLFKTVIIDGALPRKTFSMGEAHEKRFYLEGRNISE